MTALIEQTFSVFNIKFEATSDDIPVNREFYSKATCNEDGRSLIGHASCVPSVERKASKSDRSIMKSTTLPCHQTTFSKLIQNYILFYKNSNSGSVFFACIHLNYKCTLDASRVVAKVFLQLQGIFKKTIALRILLSSSDECQDS